MNGEDAKGRGGKAAKIVARTPGGWVSDLLADERSKNDDVAEFTRNALAACKAPDKVFARAFTIIRTYRRQLAVLDNPQTTEDKNKKGVGRFKLELRKRSEKMANQLNQALVDEMSHDLNLLIEDGDLRSHMEAAYQSLTAIVDLIDRASDGIVPQSYAQIRNEAGGKLKALAREHGLRVADFVLAFNVYKGEAIRLRGAEEQEAFDKWLARLPD